MKVCQAVGCENKDNNSGYCSDQCLIESLHNKTSQTEVWTASKHYFMPDINVGPKDGAMYIPLRGHAYIMMVLENPFKKPSGFVNVNELGFNTVKEWMKETNWFNKGY